MPLVAFLFLAVVCFALLGFACACLTDNPLQALERALAGIALVPALVEVWPAAALVLLAAMWATARLVAAPPSPATLQRFLL